MTPQTRNIPTKRDGHTLSRQDGWPGWRMRSRALIVALFLTVAGGPVTAAPTSDADAEIEHLFAHLGFSDCMFNRNGTWYSPVEALDHLRNKYNYLLGRGLVVTAESFVERAASQSSMTGKPYLVKCKGSDAVACRDWFLAELSRFRGERSGNASEQKPDPPHG